MMYMSIGVCVILLGTTMGAPERTSLEADQSVEQSNDHEHMGDRLEIPLSKRSPHYDFGLGKRAYSYVSEYKRLPVYNFGLGKRSRPYSFGLGKRSADQDVEPAEEEFSSNNIDRQVLAELLEQYDDAPAYEKRARPYSFGLGKRTNEDYANEEKRAKMYDFGLGKRVPLYNFGLGKRARSYSFGLGKRLSKFNFGLGKRERDLNRFSFGLGKRSVQDPDLNNENEDFDAKY